MPDLESYVSDSRLYLKLKADTRYPVEAVKIYCCNSAAAPEIRNWSLQKTEDTGEGEYICKAEVFDINQNFLAFAKVLYKDGFSASSKLVSMVPQKFGVVVPVSRASRLIYDSSACEDCFTVTAHPEFLHTAPERGFETGPFNLTGARAYVGRLSTYKPADERFRFTDGALQVSYYSPENQTFKVVAREYKDGAWGKEYFCALSVSCAELWQKATLAPNEFKTTDGAHLQSWRNIVLLSFEAEGKLLINNILWV